MSSKESNTGIDSDDENLFTIEEIIEPLAQEIKRKRYSFGIIFIYAIGALSFVISIWQLGWGSPPCQQISCQYNSLVHLSLGLVLLFFAAIVLGAGYLFQNDWHEKDAKRASKEEAILEKALLELEEQGKVPHNVEKIIITDASEPLNRDLQILDTHGEEPVLHFND